MLGRNCEMFQHIYDLQNLFQENGVLLEYRFKMGGEKSQVYTAADSKHTVK